MAHFFNNKKRMVTGNSGYGRRLMAERLSLNPCARDKIHRLN